MAASLFDVTVAEVIVDPLRRAEMAAALMYRGVRYGVGVAVGGDDVRTSYWVLDGFMYGVARHEIRVYDYAEFAAVNCCEAIVLRC